MSYQPSDEDGVELRNLSAGPQQAVPGTIGGSATLKTVTITNNENYPIVAAISAAHRLRTETVSNALRSEMEGRFSATVDVGTIYGAVTDYVEIHFPGSNGVASSSWGFPATEAFLVSGSHSIWIPVPVSATRIVTFSYVTSNTPQNFRTAGGLGYVECFNIDALIHQDRGQAFDVSIT